MLDCVALDDYLLPLLSLSLVHLSIRVASLALRVLIFRKVVGLDFRSTLKKYTYICIFCSQKSHYSFLYTFPLSNEIVLQH